ncbi:hypothetical protein N7456_010652 [Penicillium angulare]|uniref:Transcription factor domain-containing protein n=1 Tax=Penicillium angulare TaxID=116970 RepID=A0A9W9F6Z4_9EURO|nr:hypothetical protein N7456_010652 [Penicillium angulare]
MILAQCTLLLVVNLMFTGFKDNVVNLQAQRAWLATLMRRFVISSTNKDTLLSMEMKSVQPNDQWRSWIRSESGRRLAYCFAGVDPSFTATDYEQMLPSHDTLWQSRSEGEWKSLSHLLNDQTPPMSLKKIFSLNWMSNGVLQQVSEFNKLILNLMLFVEERRAIEASRSCALFEEEPTFSTKSALSPSYRRLDWKYKLLAPKPFEPSERTGNSDARNIFYHLIGILRHVPRKQLYAYSGWYASEEDMTAAEAYLAGWISENPVFSRECLVHAGALIGQIRSNGPAACYHYFCLLIATSYIWTFTRLQEQGSKELEGRPPLQPPATLLRIDQRHDPSLRDRWVENASGTLVHVTGVGMLSSQGSAERLWKEFLQIMGSRVGWPTLREGMIRCTSELLKNSSPMKGMRYSNSEVSH